MSFPHSNQIDVLITGGSAGIGLGLARRYLAMGARVLVTDRDATKLEAVAAQHNGLLTLVCDIAVPSERITFADRVGDVLPELSVVINNAGIQRRVSIAADAALWAEKQNEIDILLAGPIHSKQPARSRDAEPWPRRRDRKCYVWRCVCPAAVCPHLQCLQGGFTQLHRHPSPCASQH